MVRTPPQPPQPAPFAAADVNAIKQKLIAQGVSVKKLALYGSIEESSGPPPDTSGSAHGSAARDAKQRNLGSSIVF